MGERHYTARKGTLLEKLKGARVGIESADADTLFLRHVPTHPRFFNKPGTNLLIKRPPRGSLFLVCVDDDLEYLGPDRNLARAFASSHKQSGWQVLFVKAGERLSDPVIEAALEAVGFDGREPALNPCTGGKPASRSGLLSSFGTDLSLEVEEGRAEATVGRREALDEALSFLLQRRPFLAAIAGPSGVGKTNLLHGIARRLLETRPHLRLVSVHLGPLVAGALFDSERANVLSALFQEAETASNCILALEQLELLNEVRHGPALLAQALDAGLPLAGTLLPSPEALQFQVAPLARRMHVIELAELGTEEICEAVLSLLPKISEHHRVAVDETLARAALARSLTLSGLLPAKAIALLDAAALEAALCRSPEVTLYHLYLAASRFPEYTGPLLG
jgi:ATP-dependent Clp protease ATP-binding subunit ClpA